jgi:hypothetical protein
MNKWINVNSFALVNWISAASAFVQALSEMKDQLERSLREKQLLSEERDNLASCVSRLQGQLSDIQGQVNTDCIRRTVACMHGEECLDLCGTKQSAPSTINLFLKKKTVWKTVTVTSEQTKGEETMCGMHWRMWDTNISLSLLTASLRYDRRRTLLKSIRFVGNHALLVCIQHKEFSYQLTSVNCVRDTA